MQRPLPARFVKEVNDDMQHEAQAIADGMFVDLIFRSYK
jgi:hypothetical protein